MEINEDFVETIVELTSVWGLRVIGAYLGEAARRAIRNPGTVTLARDLK
jgi:hypothetical protein